MNAKPIEKGSFVRAEAHPEYGVGRVLSVDAFSTRVLFSVGGVRVYRNSDVGRIKGTGMPNEEDVRALDDKEQKLAIGVADHLGRPPPAAPKRARKPRAKKA